MNCLRALDHGVKGVILIHIWLIHELRDVDISADIIWNNVLEQSLGTFPVPLA